MFNLKLNGILDRLAPVKTIQVRKNYAPWLSPATKQLMNDRDIAQNRASVTNLTKDWEHYRQLRNQVNKNLKSEKCLWRANELK